MTVCQLGHRHADRPAAERCNARQAPPVAVDVAELDPALPHDYVRSQLARATYCAVCGKPRDAALHLIEAR